MQRVVAGLILLHAITGAAAAEAPSLGLPIDCVLGESCFVQQLPDIDPGSAAKDFRCGSATYDGHKGTDFRILSTEAVKDAVPVIAAADGRIIGVRDGMADRLISSRKQIAALKGRDCGNGVLIDHGDGWQTQYCHLRRSSIAVRKGQPVKAGAKLGEVGYSGNAQFPHVHLTVRHEGKVIDPFLGEPLGGSIACKAETTALSESLWQPGLREKLSYPDAVIIETGFSGAPVDTAQLETGGASQAEATSPALVFFVRAINLRKGDRLRLEASGPGGFEASSTSKPLDRNKAQYAAFTGKRLKAARWPAGLYRGEVAILRDGQPVSRAVTDFSVK